MKTKSVKIGDLQIDPKLTRIRHINPVFVSRYRQEYRNGTVMPMIIVEQDTLRIVSGNHRLTAMLAEYGEERKIDVEIRKYESEAQMLVDFTKENLSHGMPLDDFTKRKLVRSMLDADLSEEEISQVFNLPIKRIERLGGSVIQVKIGKGIEYLPKKKGFEPSGDKPLTEKQYREHEYKDRGLTLVQQASQIIRWLKNGFVMHTDVNDNALRELQKAIEGYFATTDK